MPIIIKNKRAQIIGNHILSLLPGVNEVDAKKWAEFKTSPAIVHFMGEGEIEEMDLPVPHDDSPVQIDDLNQKDAIALVKETFDIALLNRWAENETRKGVLDALEKQFDAVKLKKKSEDDAEGDEGAESDEG